MAENYFGGAPTAFQGGMEFGAVQRRRRLDENALNALIARYGPEAADPQSLAMLQRIEQGEQLFPNELAEAERINAARAAEVDERGVMAGDPAVQQRELAIRLQAARRGANVLRLTKQRKGDLGRAFDLVGNLLPALGIPPEQMAALREHVITDPDTVDELIAFLEDPSSNANKSLSGGQAMYNDRTGKLEYVVPTETGFRVIPGYTPAGALHAEQRVEQGARRIEQGARKLTNDEAKMRGFNAPTGYEIWEAEDGTISAAPIPGTDKAQEFEKNLREADAADRKYLQSFNATNAHNARVFESAQTALEFFSGARGGIIPQNWRRLAPLAAGTDMHEAWRALREIKNNIGIDELQRMRQSSPTGGAMGNVSDRDMELLTGALGELDTIRDPETMVDRINFIITEYNRILNYARADAQRAQGRIQTRETAPPRAPARSSSGTTFRPNNPFAGGGQ